MDIKAEIKSGLDSIDKQVKAAISKTEDKIGTLSLQVLELEQKGGISSSNGFKTGTGAAKAEFNDFLKTGDKSVLSVNNSASISDGGSGGYTMVPHLSETIVDTVNGENPLLNDVILVETSSQQYEQLFTSTGSTASRASENGARNLGGDSRMTKVAYDLSYMYAVPSVTEELFNSSSFDLAGYVEGEVLKGFNNALTNEILNGDTANQQCGGVYTALTSNDADSTRTFGTLQNIKTGVNGSFDYDSMVSLVHSMAPRYRKSAKFYASTEAIESLRLIKDSSSTPLWRDSIGGIAMVPQTFLGYEVVEIPEMEGIATGSRPIMFANMTEGYKLITHASKVQADVDMTSTLGIIKFYIRQMIGGGVADSNAIKLLELAA